MQKAPVLLSVFLCAVVSAVVPASDAFAGPARPVDLALVLAVDVSGSVDEDRYRLQMHGYADAFQRPEVIEAIRSGPEQAIAVTLVEWSGMGHQRQLVGWTLIDGAAAAKSFASAVAESPRAFSDWTSISDAVDFCAALFVSSGAEAARRVIDVSGDGPNNNGRPMTEARDAAVAQGIVINGLPILTVEPGLDAYYRENVIGGPGAFLVVAKDFANFGEAVTQKLVNEIASEHRHLTVAFAMEARW